MCITSAKAHLVGTKIAQLVDFHILRHNLFYANSMQNLAPGPNCMILPIPGAVECLYDTTDYGDFLDTLSAAFTPLMRGAKGVGGGQKVTLQEVGAYTVVKAEKIDIKAIQNALEFVPTKKRPTISKDLLAWYQQQYGKEAALLICCFNNDQMVKAQPMWVQYIPWNFQQAFYPGADAHDGGIPRMGEAVDRDHQLFFGHIGETMNQKVGITTQTVDFPSTVPPIIRGAKWAEILRIDNRRETNCDWTFDHGTAHLRDAIKAREV